MARLILDTGVLIAGVCGRIDMASLTEEDDVALPAIAVAEYLAGTLLDPDPVRAAAPAQFLDEVRQVLPIHDYDRTVAEHHAALLAHVRQTGDKRGPRDLIIAATARATERILLTTGERAGFADLHDVAARILNS